MDTVTERDQQIEEMLREPRLVDLPSSLRKDPVIGKVEDIPTVVHELKSSGWVWVWDTKTFERIPILHYMVPAKMNQKYPDGTYRFTSIPPKQKPKQGSIKCLLHPDDPNRKHYNELGLRICTKRNINNPFQLQMHMKKKHPQEMATIEAEKKEKELQEDRELRHMLLQTQVKARKTTEKPVESIPWEQQERVPYVKGQD